MPTAAHADARRAELSGLIARVARGDRKALGLVYDRTSAKLFGVCLRITRDREAAEDVLQQVYLKVWNRAGRFDPEHASPITWLCAIARNASIDWMRKHGGPMPSDAAEDEPGAAGLGAAMEEMAAGEERAQIFDCLDKLPPNHQQAIRLAFFDGLSHSELASTMRSPLGTTKSWIRRGLLQLRGCLQGD
ncbi:MAG: sigma-70 family RNA polymerase sigma factor [Porphyrobacter sp.]|nr:sigma-70 family RNA polymerase sigma factor [Porphyrobacter sp.]